MSGFRAFNHLEIPQLGDVNLIVGKNNAGKSTLLHALRLYASAGDPVVISSLVNGGSRGRRATMQAASDSDSFGAVRSNLYHRNGSTNELCNEISLGPLAAHPPRLTLTVSQLTRDTSRGYAIFREPDEADALITTMYEAGMVVRFGRTKETYPWEFLLRDVTRYAVRHRPPRRKPAVYVPANGLTPTSVAEYWDKVALTDYEEIAIRGLRLISPGVERISVVGARTAAEDRPISVMVKLKGQRVPVPLSQMGDGMIRILGIILALSTVKGGMLLIDEVENGIHYSAQADLWRLILQLSADLRTQVFATTHSWDCIQAFQAAAKDTKLTPALVRINSEIAGASATVFTGDELSIVTQERIEVR